MDSNRNDDLLFKVLDRMETKLDHVTERVIRVETIVDERTVKQRRQEFISRSAWTTVISGLVIGLWEAVKLKLTGHP